MSSRALSTTQPRLQRKCSPTYPNTTIAPRDCILDQGIFHLALGDETANYVIPMSTEATDIRQLKLQEKSCKAAKRLSAFTQPDA